MHSSRDKLFFVKEDFDRIKSLNVSDEKKLSLIAEMIRFNSLATIAYAKSGHIGASFSAIEVFTVLYHKIMNIDPHNPAKPDRDIFILSKGHAAAGIYATLASVGFFPEERLLTFRRFGGLQGHVDISVPGIDGNTGSLGMGISKGKGYAWAQRANNFNSSVYVMVGDGELQEGQNWEAIQSTAHMGMDNLYLIVDRNFVQTDREVSKILDISPIEEKLRTIGWEVKSIDGNNIREVFEAFNELKAIKNNKPKAIIANTIKGKGVSFMEHTYSLAHDKVYKWHGAISDKELYKKAYDELIERINYMKAKIGVRIEMPIFNFPDNQASHFTGKSLKTAFSESLVELGSKNDNIVVLDGDLADDCGLTQFEHRFPERFIEVGIAEQDMVSMAGGLALAGKLPIVNTYAAFLTSRSNEQIFNNATEESKVIYIGHLAGILPAKPGKSHQGIRDISLLRSIPNLILCAPASVEELKQMMEFMIQGTDKSCYMRLEHVPPRNDVILPKDYKLEFGKGTVLANGKDIAIISYGPLMLSEAMLAREELNKSGISVKVINLPWLNNIDEKWLLHELEDINKIFCVENHYATGGQSEKIRKILSGNEGYRVFTIGVEGFGQSGDGDEILSGYKINFLGICKSIISNGE